MFWYDLLKKQPRFSEIQLPFKSLRILDANDGSISSWLPTTSDYFKVPPALEVKYSTNVLPKKHANYVSTKLHITAYKLLKFVFSKKATKIDKIFTVQLTLTT